MAGERQVAIVTGAASGIGGASGVSVTSAPGSRGAGPGADSAVVHRLNEAGAVLIAKLSLGALALNDIWFGGQTMNPWLLEEGASGSSAAE